MCASVLACALHSTQRGLHTLEASLRFTHTAVRRAGLHAYANAVVVCVRAAVFFPPFCAGGFQFSYLEIVVEYVASVGEKGVAIWLSFAAQTAPTTGALDDEVSDERE